MNSYNNAKMQAVIRQFQKEGTYTEADVMAAIPEAASWAEIDAIKPITRTIGAAAVKLASERRQQLFQLGMAGPTEVQYIDLERLGAGYQAALVAVIKGGGLGLKDLTPELFVRCARVIDAPALSGVDCLDDAVWAFKQRMRVEKNSGEMRAGLEAALKPEENTPGILTEFHTRLHDAGLKFLNAPVDADHVELRNLVNVVRPLFEAVFPK